MNYGGDAADQIVRYSLDGVDHGLRLSGTLAKASGGICCRRIKRPEENEGQDQNGADVKGEQAIEVLHCAI